MSSFETVKKDKDFMLKVLRAMLVSRHFEEKVNEMFMQGIIHGTTHLGVGQEASHAGVSLALNPTDWILPTHRGHGHCLAKGATPFEMFCELFANKKGTCQGLGGSMHFTDIKNYNMGSSGVVAGAVPIAVGMSFAIKEQEKDQVVVSFFGDAAANQGMTAESLNLASVWKTPTIFCCENNRYGMSTPAKFTVSVEDIVDRAAGYGMPGRIVDGLDVLDVIKNVMEAAEYCREGNGPILLELKTYRYLGHSKSDQRKYRTKEEEQDIKDNHDAIIRFKNYLIDVQMITEEGFNALDKEIGEEIDEAAEKAKEVKDVITVDEALGYVYAE